MILFSNYCVILIVLKTLHVTSSVKWYLKLYQYVLLFNHVSRVFVFWVFFVVGAVMLGPNWSYISAVSTIVAESCVRRI